MEYEWDENKRQTNIQKHGKDFADAHKLWESGAPVIEEYSERRGEVRWQATGKIARETLVLVYEEKDENQRRIISFRPAQQREREDYERKCGSEMGGEDELTKKLDSLSEERENRERTK